LKPKIVLEYTGFEESEIIECATLIATKVGEEPITASRRQLVAVKRKYDHRKYQHISVSIEPPNACDISIAKSGCDLV